MEAKKPTLLDVFHSFTGGKTEMESKPYTKLYKDCGIIDKKFTVNDADINFSKVKSGKALISLKRPWSWQQQRKEQQKKL